jgi:flagellin-like hook-associated protein FlgL
MSLGVLNNLSAIYAENNLNNTNNSLNTVLQQLSSGSKINSGADDAAGLSLVDGLQANSMALAQSQTNASEGVGLLTVADGALSQVTNLLNRAVTLATEASNGTLNSSQDTAANQEYQSILSEVNNIGTTTTYNNQAVFGKQTAIYTGDSSTEGSSIDKLNVSTLSSSNLGDTGGVMAYSSGSSNVFLNLSSSGQNAESTDSLNQSGATAINVNYLVKGANGTETSATTNISVGGTTGYTNTANGMISAINNAGLGLSASFVTQAQAGVTGGGSETGIQISGGLVSAGLAPSSSSTGGTINLTGTAANELLTQGQSITLQSGSSPAVTIAITSAIDSLSTLATAINGADSNVTATVITNGDGTQSLALAGAEGSGQLTVGTSTVSATPISLAFTAGTAGATGGNATGTLGFGSAVASTAGEIVTGSVVLSNAGVPGASPVTFVMGTGVASGSGAGTANGSTFTVNGDNLGNLATAISQQLGVTTTVGTSGIAMTSTSAGTTLEQVGVSALQATPSVAQTANVAGLTASNGTDGSTTISLNGNGGSFTGADALAGTIVLQNGTNPAVTFTMGSASSATNAGGASFTTGAETVNGLVAEINNQTGSPNSSISAALNASGQIVLSSTSIGTAISMNSSSLIQTNDGIAGTVVASALTAATASTGASIVIGGTGATNDTNDTLTGSIILSNGLAGAAASTVTYTMGGVGATTGIGTSNVAVQGTSVANLLAAINSNQGNTGITAAMGEAGGTQDVMNFVASQTGGQIGVNSGIVDTAAMTSFVPGAPPASTGTISLASGAGYTAAAPTALTGSVVIVSTAGTITFTMGSGGGGTLNAGTANVTTSATTLASLATAIANAVTATNTNMSTLTATPNGLGNLVIAGTADITSIDVSGLKATLTDANSGGSNGVAGGGTGATTASTVSYSNLNDNATDTMTGSIVLKNANAANPADAYTFAMGAGTNSATPTTGGTWYSDNFGGNANLTDLAAAITSVDSNLDLNVAVSATGGTLTVTDSTTGGTTDNLTQSADTLVDTANQVLASATGNPTVTFAVGGTNSASAGVAGSIVLNNGGTAVTFSVGNGNDTATNYFTNAQPSTMAGLAATITAAHSAVTDAAYHADYDFTAAAGATGLVVTATSGPNVTTATSTLVNQFNSMTGDLSASYGNTATYSLNSGVETNVTDINSNPIVQTGDTLTGTMVLSNMGVTDTFVMGGLAANDQYSGQVYGGVTATSNVFYTGGTTGVSTLASLESTITAEGQDGAHAGVADINLSAAINTAGTGLAFTDLETLGSQTGSIAVTSSALSDVSTMSFTTPANGNISQNLSGVIALTDSGKLAGTGTLSGTVTVTNDGVTDTFVMGAGSASSTYATGGGTFSITGTSIAALATAINTEGSDASNSGKANLGLTASVDAATGGVYLESSTAGATGLTANSSNLTMTLAETGTSGLSGAANSSYTAATLNYSNGGINSGSDPISGSIVLTNTSSLGHVYGTGGGAVTFSVGAGTDTSTNYYTGTAAGDETMAGLAAAINLANTNLGTDLGATAAGTGGLTITSTDSQSVITVGTGALVDQYGALQGTQVAGTASTAATHANASIGTSGQIGATDALSGSIVLNNGGTAQTFTMGATSGGSSPSFTTGGFTLQDLATAITDDTALGLNASVANGVLNLQSGATATTITVGSGAQDTLIDTVTSATVAASTGGPGSKSAGSLNLAGGLTTASTGDQVTGSISLTGSGGTEVFTLGGASSTGTIAVGNSAGGETLGALATAISNSGIGINATVTSSGLSLTGATDNPTAITEGSNTLHDTTTTAALSYMAASAYNVGVYNSTGANSLYDSSTGQSSSSVASHPNANFAANSSASSGIATMSYSDGAGQSLSASDLSNQTDAESALTSINQAITDVAAQDGYIGAQINTLNSVSSVLSTQQENVISAQNAVQATDYAMATSNMSKYEILSQTGIAALAQANSIQQEVTKLLQ